MAEKVGGKFREHPLIAALVSDPASPPRLARFAGYVGKTADGRVRIYQDLNLAGYVEVDGAAIRCWEEVPEAELPHGACAVLVDADTPVRVVQERSLTTLAGADLISGSITRRNLAGSPFSSGLTGIPAEQLPTSLLVCTAFHTELASVPILCPRVTAQCTVDPACPDATAGIACTQRCGLEPRYTNECFSGPVGCPGYTAPPACPEPTQALTCGFPTENCTRECGRGAFGAAYPAVNDAARVGVVVQPFTFQCPLPTEPQCTHNCPTATVYPTCALGCPGPQGV